MIHFPGDLVALAPVWTVGLSVLLLAWTGGDRRLFLMDLGRPLGPADRARRHRVIAVTLITCLAATVVVLTGQPELVVMTLVVLSSMLPIGWMMVELLLARPTAVPEPSGRFRVALGPPSVGSLISAPLQLAHLALLALNVAGIAYLAPRVTGPVPLHWNAAGEVDRIGSASDLLSGPLMQLFMLGLMWATIRGMRTERQALPEDPEKAGPYLAALAERRQAMVRMVEVLLLPVNLLFLFTTAGLLAALHAGAPGAEDLVLIAVVALVPLGTLLPMAAFLPRLMRVQEQIKALAGTNVLGTRPDGWKLGGAIYYAPDDPAVWVPKSMGIGQTLNFARPSAWAFLASLIAIPLLIMAVVELLG